MSLLPFFQWCYATGLGEGIRNSSWIFPVLEAFHLIGLGVTAGAVITVDLRLLGVGLSREPASLLWTNTRPWLLGAVALMFASGIPLFMSESIKCYYNYAFWIKMTSLLLVLLFTFTFLRYVTQNNLTAKRPGLGRTVAVTSLVLWFGVAWGGRWIGFS